MAARREHGDMADVLLSAQLPSYLPLHLLTIIRAILAKAVSPSMNHLPIHQAVNILVDGSCVGGQAGPVR